MSAWRLFEDYCQSVKLTSLPADPRTVAMFVAVEADAGKSVSTLSHRLAAIRLMHLGNGHSSPHNTLPVIEVLRGIRNSRKEVGVLPNRKEALVDTTIKRLIDSLDTNTLRGHRDRALLLYGFAGALRRSEIVGINTSHIKTHEKGHVLTIPYSKGDQTGKGQTIGILAQAGSPYCPVTAMDTWLKLSRIKSGAVFRRFFRGDSIGQERLGDRAVAELIKDTIYALKDPSLNYQNFSGHSLRHGFLSSASENKAGLFKLIAQSRHKHLNTLLNYVAEQDRFEAHAAEKLLQPSETHETV